MAQSARRDLLQQLLTDQTAAAWHSGERYPLMGEADGPVEPAGRAEARPLSAGEFLIEAIPYRGAGRDGGTASTHPVFEVERMILASGCSDARPVIGQHAADFRNRECAVVTGVTEAFESVCLSGHDRIVVGDHVGNSDSARWPRDADHLADHTGRVRDLMQRQSADHQIEMTRGPRQRGRVADHERDVAQALRGSEALTLTQHLRRQIERAHVRDMRSKSAAEVRRACCDVKNEFSARRCQSPDNPFQTSGGKPLVGERGRLGTELFTHQVTMCARHTDMLDSSSSHRRRRRSRRGSPSTG